MPRNKVEKELPPVYLKITPTLLSDYNAASCIGDELNKVLFKGEKEVLWKVMPWWDEVQKKHFCYELKIEVKVNTDE